MRTIMLTLAALVALAAGTAWGDEEKGADDWRSRAPDKERIEKLIEVIPGAARLMIEMGERYQNLYWAAKLGKWEFAQYQLEEMQDLVETLTITRPKRAATAREFLARGLPPVERALKTREWSKFAPAFEQMRRECLSCHTKNDHAFITLPVPKTAGSPVLNMSR